MPDPTAKDIIGQLNALDGDEKASAIKLLQNDQGEIVKSARDKIAGAAKKDGSKALADLKKQAESAETLDDVLKIAQDAGVSEEKLEELRKAVPDRAKLEADIKAQFEKREEKLKKENLTLKEKTKELARATPLTKLESALSKLLLPEWAGDFAKKHADRFDPQEDGTVKVLKIGESTPYEAANMDEAIAFLANDIKTSLASKPETTRYVAANGDKGAGVGGSGGGAGSTTYDPAAEGKKMGEQQKGTKTERDLAFR